MIRKITKIGNSQGIILDSTVMDLAHLKVGDEVNMEIHSGGTLTVVPVRDNPSNEEISATIQQTMKDFAGTMEKLS